MANRNTSPEMAGKINVGQMWQSKTVIEVLTQLMDLVQAVSIYFRFLTKSTMHYHSSPIVTLNLSAENHGKRTKKASISKNFIFPQGNKLFGPIFVTGRPLKDSWQNLDSLHAKNEYHYKGKILLKTFP